MSDIKRAAREAEAEVKKAWRGRDGESLGDKLANAGDRAKNAVADAGDSLHEQADRVSRKAAYEQGRVAGQADRQADDERVDTTGA